MYTQRIAAEKNKNEKQLAVFDCDAMKSTHTNNNQIKFQIELKKY